MKKMSNGKMLFYALVAMAAFVAFSCSSQCECTLYESGVAVSSSTEVVRGNPCSSISSFTDTPYGKMGMECVKI